MITKLTERQTEQIDEFYKQWLAVGLNTDRADRSKAEISIEYFYGLIDKKRPLFVWLASPMACLTAINLVAGEAGAQIGSQIGAQIGAQIGSQIRSQIGSQIDSQIGSQIDSQIGSQIGAQIGAQIGSQIDSQIGAQIGSQIDSQIRSQIGAQIGAQIDSQIDSQIGSQIRSQIDSQPRSARLKYFYPTRYGSYESIWLGYYAYFVEAPGLKNLSDKTLEGFEHCKNLAEQSYWWYAFDNLCFVSEKPVEIHFNDSKMLHNESGMSIKFADDWGIYSLNGTLLNEEIVMTPAADLPAELVLKESNSQVRYEIVKKIGVERVLKDLNAKCVDTSGDGVYELLMLDLRDGRTRPFLKMLNPSTFEYHIEGVHPDCRTVEQSLNWRNGGGKPRVWAADGADWQQQGDVLMFPLGAEKLKPYPKILT